MPPPPPISTNSQAAQSLSTKAAAPSSGVNVKHEGRLVLLAPSTSSSSGGAGSASPQIFKATYSGVPVFEMICKDVAVMRRRSDSYLNATQILKVADFDKPQRTRILEREVQKGEHEKVQGGYGKYQGTWVPFERGVQLCQEYNVVHLLQPLIDYQPTQTSPPLAPKHITAASNRPRKPREPRPLETLSPGYMGKEKTKLIKKKSKHRGASGSQILPRPGMGSGMGRDSSPSVRSKANRRSTSHTRASDQDDRKSTPSSTVTASAAGATSIETPSRGPYADTLLDYFISDSETLPKILTEPPADMDSNIVIDDEGHTALHWAAAMAKVDVVRVMVQNGADTYRVNTDGQTALMRSVLFSNNFDHKTFATLLELLQKTIFTIDKDDQTVFHHVVSTAGQRGKIHAARYYLECLLDKLAQHPSELASIINVQDHVGDTALTIAARLKVGGKKVVKMLADAGADLKIRNRTGKNAEDYLLEAEQSASSSHATLGSSSKLYSQLQQVNSWTSASPLTSPTLARLPGGPPTTSTSQTVIPTVSDLFSRLTQSYEKDIFEKDQDILDARNLLQGIQTEIREGHRTIHELKVKTAALGQAEEQIRTLEGLIKREIQVRQRLRLEELIAQEEERLKGEAKESTEQPSTASAPIFSPTSTSKLQALESEVEQLQQKLTELQKQRKGRVDEIVHLKSQQGKRQHEYHRLIALCCNVAIDQVDGLLGPLLSSFGEEDVVEEAVVG
ncbi:apses-domain-containing protein [Dissophora ornata]|nr:apses-domain-containing protein [Dissophora ornata]